jgi:Holliday junction resolvasome RuvABC endonuclease subunit
MMAIGIDPGSITGVAVIGKNGLIASWQDEKLRSSRTLLRYFLDHRDDVDIVAVEDAFMGRGIHSSLVVASNHGFILGALWAAGWSRETWCPKPSEWRSVHGFRRKSEEAHEDAMSFASARSGEKIPDKSIHRAEAICIAIAAWERFTALASK